MKLRKIEKAWFEVPGDSDKAEIEVKHLLSGDLSNIQESVVSSRFEIRENGEAVRVIEGNSKKEKEETIVAVITGWKNFYNAEDETIECNEKNKLKLCRELEKEDFETFYSFVDKCRIELALEVKKQAEKSTKN